MSDESLSEKTQIDSAAGAAHETAAAGPTPPGQPQIPDHQLLRRIGGGSYGEVWLARNIMGTYRAVKIVYRKTFSSDRPYEREFTGIQKFEPISRSHEGLVDVLQVGRNDRAGYFYYVMELADDAAISPKSNAESPRSKVQSPKPGSGRPNEAAKRKSSERESPLADSYQSTNPSIQPSDLAAGEDEKTGRRESGSVPTSPSPVFPFSSAETYVPKTLARTLHDRGRLPVEECLELSLSLTKALGHLHKAGLIHRDIKPSNIIFVNGIPKLADIGLVADVGEARSFVGTEGFIPPEGPGTARADLYGLGKVIYESCTGKDRQDFPELPTLMGEGRDRTELQELNEVVLKACESDVRKRYETAEEMHADLVLMQSGKSVKRLRTVEKRLTLLMRFGLAATAIALIAAGGYWYQPTEAKQEVSKVGRRQPPAGD